MFSGQLLILLVRDAQQVLTVLVLAHGPGRLAEMVRCYPPAAQGDVLQAGHLLALTLLDHLDERRGLGKRVMSAGVQPGEATAQGLQAEPLSPARRGLTA